MGFSMDDALAVIVGLDARQKVKSATVQKQAAEKAMDHVMALATTQCLREAVQMAQADTDTPASRRTIAMMEAELARRGQNVIQFPVRS